VNEELAHALLASAEAMAAGLSAVADAITELTQELQRLRREIASQHQDQWLPVERSCDTS